MVVRSERMRRAGLLVLLVVVVLAVCWLWLHTKEVPPQKRGTSDRARADGTAAPESEAPVGAQETPRESGRPTRSIPDYEADLVVDGEEEIEIPRALASEVTLLVVDAKDGRPLPDVKVYGPRLLLRSGFVDVPGE